MKEKRLALFVISSFLFLNAILPQTLAASILTSPDSITSFSQTNLNMNKNDDYDDSPYWPDGTDCNTTTEFAKSFTTTAGVNFLSSGGLSGGEYSFTTDGDVGTEQITCNDAGDEWVIYQLTPNSLSVNNYIEVRYRVVGAAYAHMYIQATSGAAFLFSYQSPTTWTTAKAWIPSLGALTGNIIKVRLYCDDNPNSIATGTPETQWDYLRIGPASPAGWEHDCSATGNTTGFDSSTGDLLYKEMAPGDAVWSVDATATATGISPIYYPFLEMNVVDDASGGPWALAGSTATDTYTLHSSSSGTGLFHFNLRSFSANDFYSFTLTPGGITYGYYIKIDWIAVYNIANFTTTITAADVSDVAYVLSNALQITKSSATFFQFDRDPAISIAVPPYEVWNISTATPSAVGLSTYISPSWTTVDYVTNATLPTGTITDVRIRAFASCAISSVKFLYIPEWNQAGLAELWFDMPAWYVVATAILAFWTELNTAALEGLFILAGLVLIPVSTLYLVHGGREEMSNDKVFFFLVLFFVGWALFLGGIMP